MPGSASQGFGSHGLYGPLTLDYNERARGLTLGGITLQLFGCRGEATGKGLKSLSRKWSERLRWHVQIGLNLRTAEIGRHSNVQEWRQNTPKVNEKS